VLVTTRGRLDTVAVVAAHGVAGTLGAGLVRVGDQLVELSLFDPVILSDELARVVPSAAGDTPAPAGKTPVAIDLHELGAALAAGGVNGHAGPVGGAVVGSLQAVVADRPDEDARLATVGTVVWLCGPDGWVGLRPVVAAAGRRRVRLEPVGPDQLGSWVAPMVAGVLA
jgi:hypothetical protein